jgi:Domain of unknown function (DUF4349)
MLRTMTAVALVLALTACSEGTSTSVSGGEGFASAPEMAMAPAEEAKAFDDVSNGRVDLDKPVIQPDGGGGAPPGTMPLMSYSYAWNFSVPTSGMENLLNAHKKLCEDAGPANCYVTNTYLNGIGQEEGANGMLSMRASEAWVRKFETGVNDALKPFGASVYSTNRTAEELTAQIVDNEARLKSMIGHRDALQAMIDKKPGKLADLLEIEQALAQAQGDIDSRQSLLAALKLRVSMSVLNFSYQAEYAPASQSIWRPVTDAVGDFAPAFARTIGGIVRFIAAALPLLVFGALAIGALMFGHRRLSRGRVRKVERQAAEKATSVGKS